MPEGDTIFRAARALHKALAGRTVTAFETALAPLARVDDDTPIAGRTVDRVEARGKWCLIHLGAGTGGAEPLILLTHMLMSGSWHIYRTGETWWSPRSAMRVVLTCGEMQAVALNVPVAEFHTERSLLRSTAVPKLGPDVLAAGFTAEQGAAALRARAASHPNDAVADALLNQRVLAGLGNVYKSEVAFAAGVNPFRRLSTLTPREFERMAELSERFLRANVADGAGDGIVTYDGNRRTTHSMDRSDRLWVYGRQGQECRRCGATVQMRKFGVGARSTYWCPACQPWLAAPGESGEAPLGREVKLAGPRRKVGC